MKTSIRFWLVLLLFMPFIQSCSDSESDPDPQPVVENKYLVNFEESTALSLSLAQSLAIQAGYGEFVDLAKYSVKVYVVNYKTTYKGKEITASGLVTVPETDDEVPLAFVHRGTIFNNADAPSKNPLSAYAILGTMGYIAMAPDLIGFGTSKDILHPYYNYEYTAKASTDMMMAVEEMMRELEVNYTKQLYITGYSQGGYSTVATMKWIETHPEDFDIEIARVAAGAGGFNIKGVMQDVLQEETYSSPAYLAFVVQSYNETLWGGNNTSQYFNTPYDAQISTLLNGTSGQSDVNAALPKVVNELFTESFLTELAVGAESEFVTALQDNSIDDWAPKAPLKIYHCKADEILPWENSEQTVLKMQANGATDVSFEVTEGDSHATGGKFMLISAVYWLQGLEEANY
ncbi:lipase family protein [Limibacter armeniacum]|uniref:alpha/beta hydrolase family protein n=1 Tax=Limibacter armeniacum TaxID=466084 RepID=UPI002FE6C420